MITYTNLFSRFCSLENLELAFKKARKGKTTKQYVIEFEKYLKQNLEKLRNELLNKTYKPLPLKTFILRDPKTRKISVSDFRDRVVHHAVCNILEPVFDARFIYDSYANRKGKGVHSALERFDCFKRKVSHNGRKVKGCSDDNFVQGFVLKADVKHYFDTVDHQKLIEIISKIIQDIDLIDVIRKIIENHTIKTANKGMPLGNLTSQFFANVYLNELDQFIKHALKVKYYLRYVDDFVILHSSRSQLEFLKDRIGEFLKKELFLELHPQKSKIHPLGQGVDFLGFKCFYYFRLLRKRNIRKMLQRFEQFKLFLKEEKIGVNEIIKSFQGWDAYAMHANSFNLRRAITIKLSDLLFS